MSVSGDIESTPAIGDIDNDNDYEIVICTSTGLSVIDVKSEGGDRDSWKMYRGNIHRNGVYDIELLSIDMDKNFLPEEFFVSQNYPNPFNPTTLVDIHLPEKSNLNVSIFSVTGRLVNTLLNKGVQAGAYTISWSGKDQMGQTVPTGIYFMKVVSGDQIVTKKLAYLK